MTPDCREKHTNCITLPPASHTSSSLESFIVSYQGLTGGRGDLQLLVFQSTMQIPNNVHEYSFRTKNRRDPINSPSISGGRSGFQSKRSNSTRQNKPSKVPILQDPDVSTISGSCHTGCGQLILYSRLCKLITRLHDRTNAV